MGGGGVVSGRYNKRATCDGIRVKVYKVTSGKPTEEEENREEEERRSERVWISHVHLLCVCLFNTTRVLGTNRVF